MAVGARVTHAEAGVGAIVTQHRTDPRLGSRGLALLRSGCSARETIDALVGSTPDAPWRQIAAMDACGTSATWSGERVRPEMSDVACRDACAIGNVLGSARVPPAMVRVFKLDPTAPLAERLMRALEEGLAVGGELRPLRSASLKVMGEHSFPLVDLRVDWDIDPVGQLRALWNRYAPLTGDFLLRAIDPANAPVW